MMYNIFLGGANPCTLQGGLATVISQDPVGNIVSLSDLFVNIFTVIRGTNQ